MTGPAPQPVPPSRWKLPDPAAEPDGEDFVGVGADLEPGTVVDAYRHGLFPMPVEEGGEIGWWSPDPRCVLPLDGLRVTKSLRRSARRFTVTVDTAFDAVVEACANPSRERGWIDQQIQAAYGRLHRMGWTHSVEVWDELGELVGGLYGIEVGGLFAGESMFHRRSDASKVALMTLVDRLSAGVAPADLGRRLLDVQWTSSHLASLGAVEMPRQQYLRRLAVAVTLPPVLG